MIADLRDKVPGTAQMIGGSWLYNIDAYRQLFPQAYLSTAWETRDEHQFMAQWGQFVDSQGGVRKELANEFMKRVDEAKTQRQLDLSFPYAVIRLQAPLRVFYDWDGK